MKKDISKVEIKGVEYPIAYLVDGRDIIAEVYYHEHIIAAVGEDKIDAYSKLLQHIYAETEFIL